MCMVSRDESAFSPEVLVPLCAIVPRACSVPVRYILVAVVPAVVVAIVRSILETRSLASLETVVSASLATFSTLATFAAAIVAECVELPRLREAKPVF